MLNLPANHLHGVVTGITLMNKDGYTVEGGTIYLESQAYITKMIELEAGQRLVGIKCRTRPHNLLVVHDI